ncbi:hypothetical protein K491DRAFT_678334 [Lophiostoma macrostomum CBS 122681]|uniref:Uncharacterized protein n=1 Tax=Lophiostoma macrostomum CBS 122681 TaxID=1314788 RepID=A0A6A6T9Y6_9PLEO|nr:hypothetical protein K491DRAFT_678334 [Lophiostoma macrostomum CBS 122681]
MRSGALSQETSVVFDSAGDYTLFQMLIDERSSGCRLSTGTGDMRDGGTAKGSTRGYADRLMAMYTIRAAMGAQMVIRAAASPQYREIALFSKPDPPRGCMLASIGHAAARYGSPQSTAASEAPKSHHSGPARRRDTWHAACIKPVQPPNESSHRRRSGVLQRLRLCQPCLA